MKIALSITENSGDLLGAELILVLQKIYPDAEIYGLIGNKSQRAGAFQLWDSNKINVMGFVEVLKKLLQIYLLRRRIIKTLLNDKPDIFIAIDGPDFNFKIEKILKKNGIKTIHFVSPSVWAWRTNRVEKIKQSTNLILCLLPFELTFYNKHNIKAAFVGNPLANSLSQRQNYKKQQKILLMPGSRLSEIKHILPTLIASTKLIKQQQKYKFHIVLVDKKMLDFASKISGDIDISVGDAHQQIANTDLVIAASGTAILEIALIGTPVVVVYKLSQLSYYFVQKSFIAKFVSLPNIIANKELVIELLQDNMNAENITQAVFSTLQKDDLTKEFTKIRAQLSRNFAFEVEAALQKNGYC